MWEGGRQGVPGRTAQERGRGWGLAEETCTPCPPAGSFVPDLWFPSVGAVSVGGTRGRERARVTALGTYGASCLEQWVTLVMARSCHRVLCPPSPALPLRTPRGPPAPGRQVVPRARAGGHSQGPGLWTQPQVERGLTLTLTLSVDSCSVDRGQVLGAQAGDSLAGPHLCRMPARPPAQEAPTRQPCRLFLGSSWGFQAPLHGF